MNTKRFLLMMLVALMSVTGAWAQNNVIEYTAPSKINGIQFNFGANMLSHTYDSDSKTGRIVFDGDVTYIGDHAFEDAQLTSITIPSSVTYIGKYAFFCSQLTSITILGSSLTSIGEGAFYNTQLTSITLPSSVTSIEKLAFGITKLTSITIPSGVTGIEVGTFFKCTELSSVTLPSGLTHIGERAFELTKLTTITLPSSLTSIGKDVFPCMESIYIEAQTPPSLERLGSNFNTSSCILYVPVGTWSAYKAAAQWCLISHIGEVNCTLTLLSSDNTKGSVLGGGEYTGCQVVNFCAFPTDGYYFSAWSDGNTDNPRTFSIEKSVTLTALFEKLGPGMRLKVTKKNGAVYEFPVTDLESTEYYRATE